MPWNRIVSTANQTEKYVTEIRKIRCTKVKIGLVTLNGKVKVLTDMLREGKLDGLGLSVIKWKGRLRRILEEEEKKIGLKMRKLGRTGWP